MALLAALLLKLTYECSKLTTVNMIVDCYQVLGIKLECLQVFVMSQNTLVVSSIDAHED